VGRNGISTALGGLVISMLWVGYTIFQVIGGFLVDRYGYGIVIYILIMIALLNTLYRLSGDGG
jgi:MFS family permease